MNDNEKKEALQAGLGLLYAYQAVEGALVHVVGKLADDVLMLHVEGLLLARDTSAFHALAGCLRDRLVLLQCGIPRDLEASCGLSPCPSNPAHGKNCQPAGDAVDKRGNGKNV